MLAVHVTTSLYHTIPPTPYVVAVDPEIDTEKQKLAIFAVNLGLAILMTVRG